MTREKISEILQKDTLKVGLEKYLKIMDMLMQVNVFDDQVFRKNYNGFYRMRQRKPEFYDTYYELLENSKNSGITFDDTFYYLNEKFGRCEASFSSKLVATVDPTKPVWDKYVLENVGLKSPSYSAKNREQKIIKVYHDICNWYESFLKTQEAKMMINLFDEFYPNADVEDIKKVDLILWQSRDK